MKRQSHNNTFVQKWKYKVATPEEAKKQKKELSNAVKKVKERERRGRMTDSIELLKAIIPECRDHEKANQSLVMQLAIKHIQKLERKLEEQEALINELTGEPAPKRHRLESDLDMDISSSPEHRDQKKEIEHPTRVWPPSAFYDTSFPLPSPAPIFEVIAPCSLSHFL
jgi:hypothetical protein